MVHLRVEQRKQALACAGVIASAIYNVNLKQGAEPLTAADIFSELKPPEMTEEEKLEAFKEFFGSLRKSG